jgi:hypothetical protein
VELLGGSLTEVAAGEAAAAPPDELISASSSNGQQQEALSKVAVVPGSAHVASKISAASSEAGTSGQQQQAVGTEFVPDGICVSEKGPHASSSPSSSCSGQQQQALDIKINFGAGQESDFHKAVRRLVEAVAHLPKVEPKHVPVYTFTQPQSLLSDEAQAYLKAYRRDKEGF